MNLIIYINIYIIYINMEQITYECVKYITTIDNLTNTLNAYGVAIIPEVLNQVECNNMKEGMWNYLEHNYKYAKTNKSQ
jgi:hypothetical protein